jgi:Spx/MgsR family transcriptional regulator
MQNIRLYGIKNCDKVKQAVAWLNAHDIGFEFHDYKSKGVDTKKLMRWCQQLGWENIINRRGTTWRNLPADSKEDLSLQSATALMSTQPALIKRPIVELGDLLAVGFTPDSFTQFFL